MLLLKAAYAERFLQLFFKEFAVVGHLKSLDMLSLMCMLYLPCSLYGCLLPSGFFLQMWRGESCW